MKLRYVIAGALTLLAHPLELPAQLGAVPADEWALILESGRRLQTLEIEAVVDRLSLREGDIVTDVGAGTGIFSVPLARKVGPTGRVFAVEVDPGFLPMIEAKARENGTPNVEPILGAYGDPLLPRRDINLAFIHDTLHHIENRAEYLQALAGYMGPGSRIAIVDYDGNHPANPHRNDPDLLVTPDQVDGWLRSIGFERSEVIDMFDDKFYMIYTKRN